MTPRIRQSLDVIYDMLVDNEDLLDSEITFINDLLDNVLYELRNIDIDNIIFR